MISQKNNTVRTNPLSPTKVANALDGGNVFSATGTNSYASTTGIGVTAYTNLDLYKFKFANRSTAACTIDVDGIAAKKIYKSPTVQAGADDILANFTYTLQYDSSLDSAAGGFLMVDKTSRQYVVEKTASHTLLDADVDLINNMDVRYDMNLAGSNTFELPLDSSFAVVPQLDKPFIIRQKGLGQTEITAAVGVTIQSPEGNTKLFTQYAQAVITRVAANTYEIEGNLTSDYIVTPDLSVASNYTIQESDRFKHVRMNKATANTVTLPADADADFAVGSFLNVEQSGEGQTSFLAGAGATVNSVSTAKKLSFRYSAATALKTGANEWSVFGDLSV